MKIFNATVRCMVAVHVISTPADALKEQIPKILFLFLSEQVWVSIIVEIGFRMKLKLLANLDQELT